LQEGQSEVFLSPVNLTINALDLYTMEINDVIHHTAGVAFMGACVLSAHAQQSVTIGLAGPMTGDVAASGGDYANGARIAVEEINASGLTIDGQKVASATETAIVAM
jgi:branched-chain amino acid transport system substrate-binding protein